MLGISATGKGKSDENQRSRQLLKVLAISDVVIFKTRYLQYTMLPNIYQNSKIFFKVSLLEI